MNIKEYISSGIIETYVFGLATDEEREEFESLSRQYPEINEAKKEFELSLENNFLENGITPPAYIKEKIIEAITNKDAGSSSEKVFKESPVKRLNFFKYLAAASVLFFIVSLLWAGIVQNKYKKAEQTIAHLNNQLIHSKKADAFTALKPIVENPNVKWSALLKKENPTQCMAHIYWDTVSKDTYLLIGNIPQTPSDKQYQLWALINNEPLNLGVFDIKKEGLLVQMKNVQNAEAFAITIEPHGGSNTPTMDALFAVGNL